MYWFDLDNSPHVPLFTPVFKELKKQKIDCIITARDFAQTKELLELNKIDYVLVGKHAGKNKINKILNLFYRAYQLSKTIKNKKIDLAISHGSRTQLITAKKNNIKSLLMLDYEYTESKIFNFLADKILVPVYIPDKRLKDAGFKLNKIIRYSGFKEELYLNDYTPDLTLRSKLNISEQEILVVFRPPSMVGNYHDCKSEELLLGGLEYFSANPNVKCLIVNRTEVEKNFIRTKIRFNNNIHFLDKTVNGLDLLYSADIAVSGGGTMNREAALLGTETYSIFTGRRPYLDEYLQEKGRLKFIESIADYSNIKITKKKKNPMIQDKGTLVEEIIDIFKSLKNN